MRASGRPPYSHRDPSRPGRGGDRPGLTLGALAHRLISLRASLTRRLAGPPQRPSLVSPRPAQSWLTAPRDMVHDAPAPQAQPWAEQGKWAEAQAWPDHVFDDRATPDLARSSGIAAMDSTGESRIDHGASSPRVLIRSPRRPASITPEGYDAPAHSAPEPDAPAVRYTRTPDPVLQERRQRALDAERLAQEEQVRAARQAEDEARQAAERAALAAAEAERAAWEAAEAALLAAIPPEPPPPLWRQPYTPPPGVRFFRSPDRRPQAVLAAIVDEPLPIPASVSEPVAAAEPAPLPVDRDWTEVPDWAAMRAWFDGEDSTAVETWSAIQADSAEASAPSLLEASPVRELAPVPEMSAVPDLAPVSTQADETSPFTVSPTVDISVLRPLPPSPVYVLDRLMRFDRVGTPLPANGQDNGQDNGQSVPVRDEPSHEDRVAEVAEAATLALVIEQTGPAPQRSVAVSAMAARAAIRPARMPAAPVAQAPAMQTLLMQPPVAEAPVMDASVAQTVPMQAPSPVAVAPVAPVFTPVPPRPVLLRNPKATAPAPEPEPRVAEAPAVPEAAAPVEMEEAPAPVLALPAPPPAPSPSRAIFPEPRATLIPAGRHTPMSLVENEDYEHPSLELLAEPPVTGTEEVDADVLEQNALNLQQTVQDFGVRGDILAVRPGPVVTLYELEPAPGTKSSRVIGLSDDIARSMSAVSARVAVVPGRNVIGIELPNETRETVYLRELLSSADFCISKHKLALCLGKNIGGEPIIADLAKMPHLLVAGTTGSGKSVAINTMILSLLYRMKPEECRLIMVDPKMLELSVYDGIPHLLSPVVTDPKKAVIALKWAVREMEERYKKMSKIAVRNIDGYNARMAEARAKGEIITREIHTGFNRETGQAVFETEEMDLSALPYIVIVVDEMADLMMVAGKDIEGAIQRLAQMARAAGIHLIMATQRPSVDVITGTIKANFPTRISFQVTSKIDSRTILGEMGAEQLLGQGDMLFMAGGGRTTRVHGPFCSDSEVESVVAHLKRQGRPSYLEAVTVDENPPEEKPAKASKADKAAAAEAEEIDAPIFDAGAYAGGGIDAGADLYDQAVQVVMRDRKASTSYIQRRLQIGYNRAASIMERMEVEGIVGQANHAGKREILMETAPSSMGAISMSSPMMDDDDE
ncbi:DNA translocase FtsK [Methylobacterium sp. Leaf93]|uniref:DNA translocase FtsK n=3 Tax=Methylobacterium TaxID=407 RepID=UPI000700A1E9|nr:DNA translocase FtsK [Methylobacterium sp. Leaf93]KQP15459.1 cell division protein FtsK [Methylobacterium sp. Leaf93]